MHRAAVLCAVSETGSGWRASDSSSFSCVTTKAGRTRGACFSVHHGTGRALLAGVGRHLSPAPTAAEDPTHDGELWAAR